MTGNITVDKKSVCIEFPVVAFTPCALGLCQLAGREPSSLQEAAAVFSLPHSSSSLFCRSHQDAPSSTMPSLIAPLLCAHYKQHPTATIHVTSENTDLMFRSHIDTVASVLSLLNLLISPAPSHPPAPECGMNVNLTMKSLSLSFYFVVIFFFKTPGQHCFSLPCPPCQGARHGGSLTVAGGFPAMVETHGWLCWGGASSGLGVPS